MKAVAATAAAALLAGLLALVLHGPAGAVRRLLRALRAGAPELLTGAALLGGTLALAAGELAAAERAARAVLAALAFAGLWLVALRFDAPLAALGTRAARVPVVALAGACALLAWGVHHLVLGAIPHVSDEVAYLFQAEALAQGRLGFPPPPDWEAFGFLHTRVQDGLWHGIMSPGWPALLAPGVALGLPGLVNPLFAGLSVVALHRYLLRSGASAELARLAALALAASPFLVVLAGSSMAHAAALALFLGFALAWRRALDARSLLAAGGAGLALGVGILVRPVDALVTALPFGAVMAWRALAVPRLRGAAALLAAGGLLGVGLTLAYNAAVTGDPWVFAQTRYFEEHTPGQRFGLGFGDDMGTRVHGPEWPGYHPRDVPRVTGHRLAVALEDVHGLALLTAAALVYALRRRAAAPGLRELLAAAGLLVAAYAAHFYHGIAYGARHYFLALPALAVATAWPLARGLARGGEPARRARAALAAGLATLVLVVAPLRVAEYAGAYRGASPALREAVREAGLARALVLVDPAHWAWKSAFPLNRHPLARSDVLFARDRGPEAAAALVARYPERRVWRARLGPHGRVELEPARGEASTGASEAHAAEGGR